VCSLWSESTGADGRRLTDVAGNDLLSLRLHPLQGMETPEKFVFFTHRAYLSLFEIYQFCLTD
jgi:hypothetical protein